MVEYQQRCQHNWEEKGNSMTCSKCGKHILKRIKIDDEFSYGIKKNGVRYNIRRDRKRYFYPDEWTKFINSFTDDKHKLLFQFLICTGARIDEALHFKKTDLIDDHRKVIRLTVTKRKAKKAGEEIEGNVRRFEINSSLYRKLKREPSLYIFLNINHDLTLEESKKIATNKAISIRELMKRHIKKSGIKDWKNFALHNIRKTHGMWLKTIEVELSEICYRLGHDYNTYIKHYGSASLFDRTDRIKISKILGTIYDS